MNATFTSSDGCKEMPAIFTQLSAPFVGSAIRSVRARSPIAPTASIYLKTFIVSTKRRRVSNTQKPTTPKRIAKNCFKAPPG